MKGLEPTTMESQDQEATRWAKPPHAYMMLKYASKSNHKLKHNWDNAVQIYKICLPIWSYDTSAHSFNNKTKCFTLCQLDGNYSNVYNLINNNIWLNRAIFDPVQLV